ncbi:transglycosylase SLT domain-containing protein [Sulfitobacter sp. 1151]|uniref:Transglycosylase SLT domain-containing protein n=2 Tax=Parasulfitobacter algicola TaxID=2614809 RepID=A0ABX2IWG3_9RHOB|nr:transglycosylase SLT domain-containing protein [Sulfitobacter algicola]
MPKGVFFLKHYSRQIRSGNFTKPDLIRLIFLFLIIIAFAFAHPVSAAQSKICDDAVNFASKQTGVPVSVLNAITLTETGRTKAGKTNSWPWTVNMEGKGVWFDDKDSALSYVFHHFKSGARSFDVGCFQVNYKWHGQAFSSIEEMFDPRQNAVYAANFLKQLYQELGDWSSAAGAYHSRTPKFATRYRKRFDQFHAQLKQTSTPDLAKQDGLPEEKSVPISDSAGYPIARLSGAPTGLGSLVPMGSGSSAKPFFSQAQPGI